MADIIVWYLQKSIFLSSKSSIKQCVLSSVNDTDVSRHRSADELSTGSPPSDHEESSEAIRDSPPLDLEARARSPSKGGRIDWRVFHEEVGIDRMGTNKYWEKMKPHDMNE